MRFGDEAEYENFGQDFLATAKACYEQFVELPLDWLDTDRDCGRAAVRAGRAHYLDPAGFQDANRYVAHNYVSCCWGDKNGEEMLRPLTKDEQGILERLIRKCYADAPASRKKT